MTIGRAEQQAARYKRNTGVELNLIDGSTFQAQIESLAVTMTNLVEREGPKYLNHPFLSTDLGMLLRQCTYTYDLIFYINADERREQDYAYRQGYSFALLPLIRTMIDALYNATAMMEDTSLASVFRASGYKQLLLDLEIDKQRYGTDQRWILSSDERIRRLSLDWRASGFTEDQIRTASYWPTLTRYLTSSPKRTPNKLFLESLTLGYWKEYSALSHATFQGLMEVGIFFKREGVPHESREDMLDQGEYMITSHVGRAAGLLLCFATELQARYKFSGVNLTQRFYDAWKALVVMPEIQELYEVRYRSLIRSKQIAETLP